MNQLETLISRVTADKMLFLDIQDVANNRLLDNNQSAEAILQSFSDLTTYFKSFHSNRVKQIGVLVKRKNGNRFNAKEKAVIITFSQKEQPHTVTSLSAGVKAPTPQPKKDAVEFKGLNGVSKDLQIDDYINMKQSEKDFEKLITDHKVLKGKYTKERRKRKKYEKYLIKNQNTPFLETETGKQLLGFGKEALPMLIKKFTPNGSGALAGGQKSELDGMSAVKVEFFNSILKDDRLDDAIVNDLTAIFTGMINLEPFREAVTSLMYEHELKQV